MKFIIFPIERVLVRVSLVDILVRGRIVISRVLLVINLNPQPSLALRCVFSYSGHYEKNVLVRFIS
jgi:hypothetical protein